MTEADELAARAEGLPADAQYALAWQILKRLGYQTPEEETARHAASHAEALAERLALFAWEKANGLRPGEPYRAAG